MKNVKLLLTENVSNLGIVGDVVHVRPGYARNYLVPLGLATTPTQAQMDRLAEKRRQVEERLRQEREQRRAMFERLEGHEITLERSANEQGVLYGSVTQHDIGEALRADGFEVADRFVRLGEQIKELDTFHLRVEDDQSAVDVKVWIVSDQPAEQAEEEAEEPEEAEA